MSARTTRPTTPSTAPRDGALAHALRWALALVALATCGLVVGCTGTDVGNPMRETRTLELAGFLEADPEAEPTAVPGATLDEFWLIIDEVRLYELARCDDDAQVDISAPWVVELVSGAELPAAPTFTRPNTDYCKMKVKFGAMPANALPAGAPAELADVSVLVRGTRADGVAFTISGRIDEQLVVRADQTSFALTGGALFLTSALDGLFGGLDLTALGDEAPLEIDRASHPSFFNQFKLSLRQSFRLFEDKDRDGLLGPPDWAEVLARGRDEDGPGR